MTLVQRAWSGLNAAEPFHRAIALSAVGHLLIATFVFLRAAFFPSESIIIQQAIRVDVVGLPDKVLEAPEPPAPTSAPKPVVTPTPKAKTPVPTKDATAKQRDALDRLKAEAALERLREEQRQREKKESTQQKPREFRGNQVAQGSSLTGLEKIAFDEYFSAIEVKVRANWHAPSWMNERPLKARIRVLIDESGAVIKRDIVTSSGDEIFDGQVIEAIERSAPFAPPPERLRAHLSMRGLIFNFPD